MMLSQLTLVMLGRHLRVSVLIRTRSTPHALHADLAPSPSSYAKPLPADSTSRAPELSQYLPKVLVGQLEGTNKHPAVSSTYYY